MTNPLVEALLAAEEADRMDAAAMRWPRPGRVKHVFDANRIGVVFGPAGDEGAELPVVCLEHTRPDWTWAGRTVLVDRPTQALVCIGVYPGGEG